MNDIEIINGCVLINSSIEAASVQIEGGKIAVTGATPGRALCQIDARDLLVLPGIVDIHGDAFERQMMPRAGVDFAIDIALAESDRQAIGNGITTVFHAATWSWEPGLRSAENAQLLLDAIEAMRPILTADTRFHLRHETYNLDAEETLLKWIAAGRIHLFAFNDHMESTIASLDKPRKRNRMVERTGLTGEAFDALVADIVARAGEVPPSIARLASAAHKAGVRMLSHDDESPHMRNDFRALGVNIAEFPVNEETAHAATQAGDFIVFGAPNVVRGGSHTGWTKATDMIAKGYCSVLASDYYYPAPLLAAFRLVSDGVLPLSQAWRLISETPALAAGLSDRGVIAGNRRADIILVDNAVALRPRVVAVIVNGRLRYLSEPARLQGNADIPSPVTVAA